jgi:hypothetical protein
MDILLTIFVTFCVWVWGIYIGWQAREVRAKQVLAKYLDEMEQDLEDEVDDTQVRIKIEKHPEGYFVYGLDNNEFIAQGQTRLQLERALEKRYPGKKFAATADNLREVGFVDVFNSK